MKFKEITSMPDVSIRIYQGAGAMQGYISVRRTFARTELDIRYNNRVEMLISEDNKVLRIARNECGKRKAQGKEGALLISIPYKTLGLTLGAGIYVPKTSVDNKALLIDLESIDAFAKKS